MPSLLGLRARVRRHWPTLRLRTVLVVALLFACALPVLAAGLLMALEDVVRAGDGRDLMPARLAGALIAAAAIVATIFTLAALLGRSIARPIDRLTAATRVVAEGRPARVTVPPTAALEIRELYRNFEAMAATIAHRSAYITSFAAAVSHEFKTPLAAIRGAVELLQDHGATMNPEERARFVANMGADAERLSRLVGRLTELARAEAGALPVARERTPLRPVLDRLAERARGEGLTVVLQGPLDGSVALPTAALETALANLATNSAQHGARRLDVQVAAGAPGGAVAVSVQDDGPGVAPEDAERLFQPFFTTRRAAGGTGLGLAISRALLRAHGGDLVLARPAPGAGACFRLTLPEG